MKMYHGTSLKRGGEILKEGKIKKYAPSQFDENCLIAYN